MPVFEFRLTCINDESCKHSQNIMSDFKNELIRGNKSYDHIATKKFPSWDDAIIASKNIEKELGKHIVDLTIAEK